MTDILKVAMDAVDQAISEIPDRETQRPTAEQAKAISTQVTDNPKQAYGHAKPSIHFLPTRPLLEVAEVMRHGAEKYGVRNWRQQPIKASTYFDAMYRHANSWYEDLQDTDPDSMRHHLAHLVANVLIVLDAIEHNTLIDDRDFSEVIVR